MKYCDIVRHITSRNGIKKIAIHEGDTDAHTAITFSIVIYAILYSDISIAVGFENHVRVIMYDNVYTMYIVCND